MNSNILDRYQKGMVATQGWTLTSTGKVQCVEFKIFLNRLDCMFYLCSEAISPAVKSCLQFTTRITWDFLQKCSPQGTFPTGITPPGTRCHWMQKQCASVSLGKTLSWCAHMGNLKGRFASEITSLNMQYCRTVVLNSDFAPQGTWGCLGCYNRG